MGLDIEIFGKGKKHLGWFRAGSYNYFNDFRNFLVDIINTIYLTKNIYVDELIFKKKGFFKELLFHSDCEGKLNFSDCKRLLKCFNMKELKEVLVILSLDEKYSENFRYFKQSLDDWRKGLKLAVDNKGHLVFC